MFPYIHIQVLVFRILSSGVCIGHCNSQLTQRSTRINLPSLEFYFGYYDVASNNIPMMNVSRLLREFYSGFTGKAYIIVAQWRVWRWAQVFSFTLNICFCLWCTGVAGNENIYMVW
jgi:hypothetical protein